MCRATSLRCAPGLVVTSTSRSPLRASGTATTLGRRAVGVAWPVAPGAAPVADGRAWEAGGVSGVAVGGEGGAARGAAGAVQVPGGSGCGGEFAGEREYRGAATLGPYEGTNELPT